MLRASNLRQVDREYEIYLSAWQNSQVQATETKGSGKHQKQEPVYKTFNDFFDYEQERKRALGEEVDDTPEKQPQKYDDKLISAMINARG